ncbi:uncharacterized protein LOC110597746 [Ictidomys tridecemlineatus]
MAAFRLWVETPWVSRRRPLFIPGNSIPVHISLMEKLRTSSFPEVTELSPKIWDTSPGLGSGSKVWSFARVPPPERLPLKAPAISNQCHLQGHLQSVTTGLAGPPVWISSSFLGTRGVFLRYSLPTLSPCLGLSWLPSALAVTSYTTFAACGTQPAPVTPVGSRFICQRAFSWRARERVHIVHSMSIPAAGCGFGCHWWVGTGGHVLEPGRAEAGRKPGSTGAGWWGAGEGRPPWQRGGSGARSHSSRNGSQPRSVLRGAWATLPPWPHWTGSLRTGPGGGDWLSGCALCLSPGWSEVSTVTGHLSPLVAFGTCSPPTEVTPEPRFSSACFQPAALDVKDAPGFPGDAALGLTLALQLGHCWAGESPPTTPRILLLQCPGGCHPVRLAVSECSVEARPWLFIWPCLWAPSTQQLSHRRPDSSWEAPLGPLKWGAARRLKQPGPGDPHTHRRVAAMSQPAPDSRQVLGGVEMPLTLKVTTISTQLRLCRKPPGRSPKHTFPPACPWISQLPLHLECNPALANERKDSKEVFSF